MMDVMDMVNMMLGVVDVVMVMLFGVNRGRIRAGGADNWSRESQSHSKPEGRDEGLIHGIVSFFRRLI